MEALADGEAEERVEETVDEAMNEVDETDDAIAVLLTADDTVEGARVLVGKTLLLFAEIDAVALATTEEEAERDTVKDAFVELAETAVEMAEAVEVLLAVALVVFGGCGAELSASDRNDRGGRGRPPQDECRARRSRP